MASEPLVSISLCTYNGERFLVEQIDSILDQTYKNFELVIVDDNSTDGTIQIISNYLPHPKIRLYRNDTNLGYAANFSKAITFCDGDLIALSDQDDVWMPEKIESLVEKLGSYSGLYHDSNFVDAHGNLTGLKLSDKVHFVSGKSPESLLLYNYIAGHTFMFRREVLEQALPIPKGIYHDWWLAFVCMNLDGLNFIQKPLVNYRIHELNQTVLAHASGKIYRTDTKNTKRYKKLRKLADTVRVLSIFSRAAFINNQLKESIGRLVSLEKGRVKKCFAFDLFFFLVTHFSIYSSAHRGYLGKLNAMRKDSFGIYRISRSGR